MSRPWILLCPSTRGIGHFLTRHLLQHTHPSIPILATSRSGDLSRVRDSILRDLPSPYPSASSSSISDRLHLVELDVTSEATVEAASQYAASLFPPSTRHLHMAFALPGVLLRPEKSANQIDYGQALETYKVNVLGPMLLMKWFGGFLPRKMTEMVGEGVMRLEEEKGGGGGDGWDKKTPGAVAAGSAGGYGGEGDPVRDIMGGGGESKEGGKGKGRKSKKGFGEEEDEGEGRILKLPHHATWVNMSARVGSVSDNNLGGWYSYRSSKTAVNSLTKCFDHELETKSARKALAVSYHPGTVKTGLSKDFWDSVANDSLFEPEDAADKMARVLTGLRVGQRGRCWDWKGQEVAP